MMRAKDGIMYGLKTLPCLVQSHIQKYQGFNRKEATSIEKNQNYMKKQSINERPCTCISLNPSGPCPLPPPKPFFPLFSP
jgi:hypothetical protein